jgi:alpha-beta hydrolase superfamily lysophospholipase
MRTINPVLPDEMAIHEGLAYSLWLPAGRQTPHGGVVILHGAGSCKENHHDFARAAVAAGLGAIAFDQRGHGESEGPMDAGVLDDVASMADLLRRRMAERLGPDGPAPGVALRGSSLGGYVAILAAPVARARAVVALCPASAEGLLRGLTHGSLRFEADRPALEEFLIAHDVQSAVASLTIPLLLLHAEGDEQVPVEHSRELAQHATHPQSRLVTVPGGHHRSVQHDPELNAVALRFLGRTLGAVDAKGTSSV